MISDHARMMTIAISDGVCPGTQYAGGVLRHVMRRALRAGYAVFEIPEIPFLAGLVPTVVKILGDFYEGSYSETTVEKIVEVVKWEEELFGDAREGSKFLTAGDRGS
jgi:alanyl-tRNA synthetase